MKLDNRKKAGALQPIPLPERAWQQITTDLVIDLPESEGKTTIAVYVDRVGNLLWLLGVAMGVRLAGTVLVLVSQFLQEPVTMAKGGLHCKYQ